MFDLRARDGRTIDRTARLARRLAHLCWATVLLPLGLGCVFSLTDPRPSETMFYAAVASGVLLVGFVVPAVAYRVAAGAVDRYRTWGAAVVIGTATIHAGGAGWVAYWMGRWLRSTRSMSGVALALTVLLLAVVSLVTAVAAVARAYEAIGAIRRLSDPVRPLGFAPVMPAQVRPDPPSGEPAEAAKADRPKATDGDAEGHEA